MGLPLIGHPLEMAFTSGVVLMAALLSNYTADPPSPHHLKLSPANQTRDIIPVGVFPSYGNSSLVAPGRLGSSSAPEEVKAVKKRESKTSALVGKTLRIATLKDWPLSDIKLNKTNNKQYGIGVAFRLVELLQKEFGFNYTIVPSEDNTANTVMRMVLEAKVDMAAAFIPMVYNQKIIYSKPLAKEEWVVLLRRPQESASGSSLLAPFDSRVWILILLSVSIVGPVIFAIMVVRVRLCRGSARLSKVFSLTSCVWFVYGALMKQGSTLSPVSDSSRLLFATWWIFITVVTAFYTANLTAFLTLSRFTLPIDGPLDIAVKSFKWMALSGSPIESVINENDRFILLRNSVYQGLGKFMNSSDDSLLELVRQEGTMFIREKRVVNRLLFKDYLQKTNDGVEESQRCTFAITPESFFFSPLGFIYPANSSLPNLFNPMLTWLVEAGIVNHLMNSDLPKSEICPLNLGNKDRQLRNSDLMTTYKAVCIGLLISMVAFVGEQTFWWCLQWRSIKSKGLLKSKVKGSPFASLAMHSMLAQMWLRAVRNQKASDSVKGSKGHGESTSKRRGAVQGGKNDANKSRNDALLGREYIQVWQNTIDGLGIKKLIPIRAPSAVLFERTHNGQGSQFYSRENEWKGLMNVI